MQDAIYNQIQLAQNIANTPYEGYKLPTVASLSPLQQQAYTNIQANQGSWSPQMSAAQTGMQNMSGSTASYSAGQPGLTAQATLLNKLQGNLNDPYNTLNPYVKQATDMSGLTKAQPYMTDAYMKAGEAGNINTATGLGTAQNKYLDENLADTASAAGQGLYAKSAGLNAFTAASPYLNKSDLSTALSLSERATAAADPYMQAAAKSSAQNIGQYMNPYTQNVTNQMAKLGARNLSENLLPAVSDQFVRAGQFGGSRMGEFGSRALRDTQEAVLNQQAQALQSGYGQALGASQADLARQAQLAGTAGSISGADLSRILQGASQYGNLGQTAGQLTSTQMQNLTNLGQAQTAAGQAQQQFGLNAAQASQAAEAQDAARKLQSAGQISSIGQNIGNLTQAQQQMLLSGGQALSGAQQQAISQGLSAAGQYGTLGATAGQLATTDAARQMSALNQIASMAQQRQGMQTADAASLEAAGAAQRGQSQAELSAAYQQFQNQQLYPKQQMDWLSTQIRGMAPITPQTTNTSGSTTTFAPSPLSQLATGLYAYKGLNALGQPVT
jgi:hypothetical protein